MCERIFQRRTAHDVASALQARLLDAEPGSPRFAIAAGAPLTVVRRDGAERVADSRQWGLIAPFFSSAEYGLRCSHARADSVNSKAAFRGSFRKQRCVIPVDGFLCWRADDHSEPPYAFSSRDGAPLLLAALWADWHDPETHVRVGSCALITTPANGQVIRASRRMPAILSPELLPRWLGEQPAQLHDLQAMLRPAHVDVLRTWPVSDRVREANAEGADLVEALS